MSRRRRLTWLDVFTATPFSGNGLAVVHDADGVPETAMQAFARETRLSETSFLQSPQDSAADYRHRIWMVRGEIPFAGHPSLGAAVAHARARGDRAASVVQQTRAGLHRVEVEVAGDRARASMVQDALQLGPVLDAPAVLGLVGLDATDADLPVRVAATGVPQVLAVVHDAAAVGRCRAPATAELAELLDAHDAIVLYVAAFDGERAVARGFFPGGEDPATGSAVGPLCAYVHASGGPSRLVVQQGVEIGRPSRLEASVEGGVVRVGGEAVVVADGELALPEAQT